MARVLFIYAIDGCRRFDRRPLSAAAIQLGLIPRRLPTDHERRRDHFRRQFAGLWGAKR